MSDTFDRDLLLRCMIAAASADGTLADAEVELLASIYHELTGEEVDEETIRRTLDAVWETGSGGLAYIVGEGADEELESRILIARACYRVMAADGEITGPEAGTFNEILGGLALPRKTVMERL